MKLDRCCKPKRFGKVISLHYFSDTSESGYWQAKYLRLVDAAGEVQNHESDQ